MRILILSYRLNISKFDEDLSKSISSKVVANFDVDDHSNEFVYHRNDRRNKHKVSFRVCRDKNDGALIRPKLPAKTIDKEEIRTQMLNENNDNIDAPRIYVTKKVLKEFSLQENRNSTMKVVEQDIHDQESSFKVRLLKRENILNERRKLNNSGSNSNSMISSPSKSGDKDPKF